MLQFNARGKIRLWEKRKASYNAATLSLSLRALCGGLPPGSGDLLRLGENQWPLPSRPSGARVLNPNLSFFVIFCLLTVFVTYMKNARIFDPTSEIAQHFAPVRWYLVPHAFFGILAIVLGVFQFSNRLRARYLKIHRTLGYVYVVSVFIAAPLAIPMTMRSVRLWLRPRACNRSGGC